MLKVSDRFKQEVENQTMGRKTSAKVRFEIVDDLAYEDVALTFPNPSSLSPLAQDQLTDRIRSMSDNYGTFEENRFLLNGGFKVAPTSQEIVEKDINMGFWSEELSNANGVFQDPLRFELTFTEKHKSVGLSLYFDNQHEEYPVDFDIRVYEDDILLKSFEVRNNERSPYILINKLINYNKVEIDIFKWSKPNTRCKVSEITFGIVEEYTDDELINVRTIQELSPTSKTIPSDEIKFKIDNSSKLFNPLNPKGFYEFLTKGQEVYSEIGVEVREGEFEYVPVGKFYLYDWTSDDGTLTATFTARDMFEILNDREVEEDKTPKKISLYDFIENIMIQNDVEEYKITPSLKNIYTDGVHRKMSYRRLLEHALVIGKCVAFQDNYGIICIEEMITATDVPFAVTVSEPPALGSVKELTNGKSIVTYNLSSFEKDRWRLDGSYQLPTMNDNDVGWWSDQICDEEGSFEIPIDITFNIQKHHNSKTINLIFDEINKQHPKTIDIVAYDFNDQLLLSDNVVVNDPNFIYQNEALKNTSKIKVSISNWNIPFRRCRILEIDFDPSVYNILLDNMYDEPRIKIQPNIKAIEVSYTDRTNNEKKTVTIESEIEDGKIYKISNPLIVNQSQAKDVAEWLMNELSKNAEFEIDWRQNPSLTLWDKVGVENGYETITNSNIIRQELEYGGYLRGKTVTKGMI